ncbi:MAG: FAD-dependent monooxygenase [Pseudomonadaceae bacterium]|nr:FAD-dependent monooxygenase [Pseudomonadaceae bacterium]
MPDRKLQERHSTPLLVAGGGIGGLAAALALAKQGCDVSVFERAGEFSEIGAGIQLSPNCLKALFDVGLEEPLREVAFVPAGGEMRDWKSGRVIVANEFGDYLVERYGYPYFHVHRADLINVLVDAAKADGRIELHVAAAVRAVDDRGDSVHIDTDAGSFEGAALIGADGIQSLVREHLFGPADPSFTGNVAWRALVPVSKLPTDLIRPMATAWWGPGKHFVHYYVRRGELVNCVCVVEKDGWEVESWTERGELAELRRDFAGWHPDLGQLIDNIDEGSLFKWALFDRPPMPAWSRNRVTLLGDACHPTLPFMAQGAAMAIEDGAVLARCLASVGDVDAAFKRYESLRMARTAGVQHGSRRNARVFHMRGINARLRNLAAGRASGNSLDKLFRYDPLSAAD